MFEVRYFILSSIVAQTVMHRRRHSTNVKCLAWHRAGFRVWVSPWALESGTNFPLKGWELYSALDRVQKKTKRLLNYIVVVVGKRRAFFEKVRFLGPQAMFTAEQAAASVFC